MPLTDQEYTAAAKRTESYLPHMSTAQFRNNIRVTHHVIGLVTEAGELLDHVKRGIFYGKEADELRVLEELGDLQYYAYCLLDAINESTGQSYTMADIRQMNINKLAARYPEKFDQDAAINRDVEAEYAAMR
jgi:NTP pyrophosphatase (non-canonical NTP hydrolase)